MIRNRDEAVAAALADQNNVPGTCQLWTRNVYLAPSAGDVDGDGDADAVDGWLKEPVAARHSGDRNPPAGVPLAWSGGSRGFGHRAVSLGGGRVRSTDMSDDGLRYQPGNIGTSTIAGIDRVMGLKYLGWSETITGIRIPLPPAAPLPPKPAPKPVKNNVTRARDLLLKAQRYSIKTGQNKRAEKIKKMLRIGPKR